MSACDRLEAVPPVAFPGRELPSPARRTAKDGVILSVGGVRTQRTNWVWDGEAGD